VRFHRVPGFSCRWEAHAWLFDRGCSLHTRRLVNRRQLLRLAAFLNEHITEHRGQLFNLEGEPGFELFTESERP